ncbi:hypothetical protein LWI28_018878 [Acer negundo]|uniref:Uncharacterized protein n=1 Tax=Acer negundo TaxID=4023 RepID=A0AAD5JQR2_ACENE|nr:hypothetical protein LWI28_018878 [Acer negundo]
MTTLSKISCRNKSHRFQRPFVGELPDFATAKNRRRAVRLLPADFDAVEVIHRRRSSSSGSLIFPTLRYTTDLVGWTSQSRS